MDACDARAHCGSARGYVGTRVYGRSAMQHARDAMQHACNAMSDAARQRRSVPSLAGCAYLCTGGSKYPSHEVVVCNGYITVSDHYKRYVCLADTPTLPLKWVTPTMYGHRGLRSYATMVDGTW